MRRGAARAALALLIAIAGLASAAPREETLAPFDLADAAELPRGVGEIEPFRSWLEALGKAPSHKNAAALAAELAPNSGLTPKQMKTLIELWRAESAASVGLDGSPSGRANRRSRFAALLAASGRAPLVLQSAAAAEGATLDCQAEAFTTYLAGASDREAEGWALASTADCSAWYRSYMEVAPAKAALPLLKLADGQEIQSGAGLAVLAALASERGLARFESDDKGAFHARMAGSYLEALLDSGLIEDAVAFHESLPNAVRSQFAEPMFKPLEVRADGFATRLAGGDSSRDLATAMIAAYAVAGRTEAAARLFAEAKGPERIRGLQACGERAMVTKPSPDCRRGDDDGDRLLLFVDHILHAGEADPYPLAEMLAGGFSDSHPGLMAELRCRVFREAAYAPLCKEGREHAAYEEEKGYAASRTAAVSALPAIGASAESIESFERRARAAFPAKTAPSERSRGRASIDPLPPPFEERALPPGLRSAGQPSPKGLAPLPDGYALIRAEVGGKRAVAISASQNYDPAGEVSMGGYWIHLSEDGGRSWQRPLYTGLADRFPYVVPIRSPLPLLDGDWINLAVEVNLLDTATITYPPVGIRSRARRSGLYLRIPLEALRKDSDQDGLSDIAARHLLLDPESMADGSPVRLDGNGQACSREEMAAQEPLRLLLEQAFGTDQGAVMEPLDRKPEQIVAGERVDVASLDRPMLIRGDPADFRCLRVRRLAVVYADKDIEQLRRMSPDFHPVEIRRILFNRARDRGHASWSAGWTGGTIRFRRTATGWTSETISSWIT